MVAGFFCSARSKSRHKQQALEFTRRSNHGKLWLLLCVVCLTGIALLRFSPLLTEEWETTHLSSLSEYLPYSGNLELLSANCNIFSGRWVYDPSYPLYEASSCLFVESGFQCMERGRHDIRYRQWRWQPRNCNIPRFDSTDMLEKLQNSRVVFVGDSMGRTQWESLICLLAKSVPDKGTIFEENGRNITKTEEHLAVKFSLSNLTIEYYRAPFLVAGGAPPKRSPKRVKSTLQLDRLHPCFENWKGADVLVVNSGHWWTDSKTFEQGNYFQSKGRLMLGVSVSTAHYLALKTWASWVESKVNTSVTNVFFRSFEPGHWAGYPGQPLCEKAAEPSLKGVPYPAQEYPQVRAVEYALSLKSGPISLLNVTTLSDMRVDAHVSKWGDVSMDCSHWCLPGVPDVWNELLYASLRMKGQGVWGHKPEGEKDHEASVGKAQ